MNKIKVTTLLVGFVIVGVVENINRDSPLTFHGELFKEETVLSPESYSEFSTDPFKLAIYPLLLELEEEGNIVFNDDRTSYSGTLSLPNRGTKQDEWYKERAQKIFDSLD